MRDFLTTLVILASAAVIAALCILPQTRDIFPFWVIAAGAHIADTLFHELGHTVFSWLFGTPALPMIMTLFGADQASGLTLAGDRHWVLQLAAFLVLGFACYRLWQQESRLFVPAVLFSLVILSVAFTPYYLVIILFMGHGGATAVGGWLLYRGALYLDARNMFERWLNAFLGFFLILANFYFGYRIAFDERAKEEYSAHVPFGIGDNDLQAITDRMWGFHWSLKGAALFTMIYCCAVLISALVMAVWRREDSEE